MKVTGKSQLHGFISPRSFPSTVHEVAFRAVLLWLSTHPVIVQDCGCGYVIFGFLLSDLISFCRKIEPFALAHTVLCQQAIDLHHNKIPLHLFPLAPFLQRFLCVLSGEENYIAKRGYVIFGVFVFDPHTFIFNHNGFNDRGCNAS